MGLNTKDKEALRRLEAVLSKMEKGTGVINCEDKVIDSYYEDLSGYDVIETAHIYIGLDRDTDTPDEMLSEIIEALKSGKTAHERIVVRVYDNSINLYEVSELLYDVLVQGFEPYEYIF